MRLRFPADMFAKLPFSLLLTSLALATSALPVESVELLVLTPDNFDSTVADGVWFIEHFSPYCHHCRQFAPMWEKLVAHYESMDEPGVRLAQVNCATHGDLCNAHGVTGYPQMNLYKSGEFLTKFKGARTWDELTSFIDGYSVHSNEPEPAVVATPKKNDEPAKVYNSNGMVQAVDKKGLEALVEEGPVFVKFYAPWCGHCKKLAPIWTQLAAHMRHKLNVAEVNCDEHSALCKEHGVQGYPSLFFYPGGKDSGMHKTEYSGGRKFEQMRKFAEMAVSPAVVEIKNQDDYEHYVKESPVLYLFLHGEKDTQALAQLTSASNILLGSPKILTSSNTSIRSRFAVPSELASSPILLAIKDNIPYSASNAFDFPTSGSANKAELSQWLLANRLPSALALGQETFQDVMNAPHAPLVVIAAVNAEGESAAAELVKETAKAWRHYTENNGVPERDVVFTWMDADKWAAWMKSMYGIKSADLPAVVVTDHQNLIYYDKDAEGHKIQLETQKILRAVEGVLEGKVSSKYSENFIERMARRLNRSLEGLESAVVAHPYRTGFFFIGLLGALIMFVKRFVADDSPSDYHRVHKSSKGLD